MLILLLAASYVAVDLVVGLGLVASAAVLKPIIALAVVLIVVVIFDGDAGSGAGCCCLWACGP